MHWVTFLGMWVVTGTRYMKAIVQMELKGEVFQAASKNCSAFKKDKETHELILLENPNWFFFLSILVDCNAVLKALQPIFQEQGMTETVHNWEDHGYLATYIKKNGRWVDFLLFLRDWPFCLTVQIFFSLFWVSFWGAGRPNYSLNSLVYEVSKTKQNNVDNLVSVMLWFGYLNCWIDQSGLCWCGDTAWCLGLRVSPSRCRTAQVS